MLKKIEHFPLSLILLSSWGIYLAFPVLFPLNPDFFHAPLPDTFWFTPSLLAGLAYVLILGLLYFLYLSAWHQLERNKAIKFISPLFSRGGIGPILMIGALFSIPLILTFPLNATDVFRYFIRARIALFYEASPFSVSPSNFANDPYLSLAGEWSTATSPYGPIWEMVSAVIVWLSGSRLHLALILYKGMAILIHLASGWLIWKMLDELPESSRRARTALWTWNPALLLIFAVDGHNDGLMLFWLLLGTWLLKRGKDWGIGVMLLAPLTKPIGLLPLPFFLVALFGNQGEWHSRVRWVMRWGLASLALAFLAFLPFGALEAQVGDTELNLIQRLWLEASSNGGFSPQALIFLFFHRIKARSWTSVVSLAITGSAAVATGWLLRRTAKGRSPIRAAADIFGIYLLQAFKFRIWYASWPFPWLLLDQTGGTKRLKVGLYFLLTTQISVFVYGHLWRFSFGNNHLSSHTLGIPLVFVAPWLLTWLGERGQRRRIGK